MVHFSFFKAYTFTALTLFNILSRVHAMLWSLYPSSPLPLHISIPLPSAGVHQPECACCTVCSEESELWLLQLLPPFPPTNLPSHTSSLVYPLGPSSTWAHIKNVQVKGAEQNWANPLVPPLLPCLWRHISWTCGYDLYPRESYLYWKGNSSHPQAVPVGAA